uniref:Methionine--tRNA ligase, mitochondrial n=1 Tax=Rhabditophanes sp. KR3021 TaxID=114890 RepID=A0AC35UER7_9BILA
MLRNIVVRSKLLLHARQKSFITTPIYYANAAPHIGHVYSSVIADAGHRYAKLRDANNSGYIFSTGTDEHGIKIQKAAADANEDPQQFCDKISNNFRQIFDKFNVGYTDYVRTTDDKHKKSVQVFWDVLMKNGHIYKDKYSGYYSQIDETFYQEKDIEEIEVDGVKILISKESKSPVQFVEEENYMFNISKFYPEIIKWLNECDVIRPKHYLPQVLSHMRHDEKLSISRDSNRMTWGIAVPNDPSQTIYVWLDALVNYLSVVNYPNMTSQQWPPTWQILGKDIMKFHAVYWPAFLLASGNELPEKMFIHAHWTIDNVKMSKSKGNVIDPYQMADLLSVDGVRYFLLRQGIPHDDGNFSIKKSVNMVNADLVNNIGNMLMRSTGTNLNVHQVYFPQKYETLDEDVIVDASNLLKELRTLKDKTSKHYDDLLFYKALENIMSVCKQANGFFQTEEPWKKSCGHETASILYITYETLRIVGILLQPIVPEYADKVLNKLGIPKGERLIQNAKFEENNLSNRKLGDQKEHVMERIEMPK